jgi:hypothetical protein
MPCDRIGPAIVCSRGRRQHVCVECGGRASKLCDGPGRRKATTCNRELCSRCAYHVPPDRDYCRAHRPDLLTEAVDLLESRLVDK